jgi:hypothetical protein
VGYEMTAMNELTNGRWLGERGIFRHYAPDPEDVDFDGQEVVYHTMVTAIGYDDIEGELIRGVADDVEVLYEVRINGLDEHYGVCDAVAYSIDSLAGLAKVANDLRYEWEIIAGVYPEMKWSVF